MPRRLPPVGGSRGRREPRLGCINGWMDECHGNATCRTGRPSNTGRQWYVTENHPQRGQETRLAPSQSRAQGSRGAYSMRTSDGWTWRPPRQRARPGDTGRRRPGHGRRGANGHRLGDVEDLVVDDQHRRARLLVVISGGILGLGATQRLVPVEAVTKVDDRVHVELTRALRAVTPRVPRPTGRGPRDPALAEAQPYAEVYATTALPRSGVWATSPPTSTVVEPKLTAPGRTTCMGAARGAPGRRLW